MASTERHTPGDSEYVPKHLLALAKLDGEAQTLIALGNQIEKALSTVAVKLDPKMLAMYRGLMEFVNAELKPRIARLTGGELGNA